MCAVKECATKLTKTRVLHTWSYNHDEEGLKSEFSCWKNQSHISQKAIRIVRSGSTMHTGFPVRSSVCPKGYIENDEDDGGRDSGSSKVCVPRASCDG